MQPRFRVRLIPSHQSATSMNIVTTATNLQLSTGTANSTDSGWGKLFVTGSAGPGSTAQVLASGHQTPGSSFDQVLDTTVGSKSNFKKESVTNAGANSQSAGTSDQDGTSISQSGSISGALMVASGVQAATKKAVADSIRPSQDVNSKSASQISLSKPPPSADGSSSATSAGTTATPVAAAPASTAANPSIESGRSSPTPIPVTKLKAAALSIPASQTSLPQVLPGTGLDTNVNPNASPIPTSKTGPNAQAPVSNPMPDAPVNSATTAVLDGTVLSSEGLPQSQQSINANANTAPDSTNASEKTDFPSSVLPVVSPSAGPSAIVQNPASNSGILPGLSAFQAGANTTLNAAAAGGDSPNAQIPVAETPGIVPTGEAKGSVVGNVINPTGSETVAQNLEFDWQDTTATATQLSDQPTATARQNAGAQVDNLAVPFRITSDLRIDAKSQVEPQAAILQFGAGQSLTNLAGAVLGAGGTGLAVEDVTDLPSTAPAVSADSQGQEGIADLTAGLQLDSMVLPIGGDGLNASHTTALTGSEPIPVAQLPTHLQQLVLDQLGQSNSTDQASIVLKLDPPELGKVNVHLVLNNDVVSIRMVTSDHAARQVIESQLGGLQQSLAGQGVQVDQCRVDCFASMGQQSFSQGRPKPALPFDETIRTSQRPNSSLFKETPRVTPSRTSLDFVA